MSIIVKIDEPTASVSRSDMESKGITAIQLLSSLGEIMIEGKLHKITKLIDTDTGTEIK